MHTSSGHLSSTPVGSPPLSRRLVGAVAACSTVGLAAAHLVVNIAGLPADAGPGLIAGVVLAPAVLALVLSWSAVLIIARSGPPGRVVRWSIIVGAALMWLLLAAAVVW